AELIINEFASGSRGTIAISDASGGTALTVGNSDDSTFQGVIEDHTSGSGSVLKSGTGTVTFSGASTYSGSTTISEGTLQIGNSLALQNSTVSIDVDDGLDVNGIDATLGGLEGTGTLDLGTTSITIGGNNEDTTYSGVISGTGSVTKSGTGTTTLSGDNTYTGTTTISGGILQVGDGGSAGALAGNIINNANLIFNRSSASTYAGDISGTGTFMKQGSGTLTLTGTHSYTGATAIDAGILQINGSLGNTAVAVNNGATLGGSGTITGGVTVNSGGTLAPGNSPGTLTLGSLTLNAGSTTQFEINGTTAGTDYDQIVVTGTAQLAGTAELSFGFTPSNGDTFTLIDAATITGDFDSVVNSLGNALLFTTSVTDDYILTITAVQTSFASDAFTGGDPELIAIATVLDDNFSDPVLESLIDALNGLPGTDLEAAFEEINPDELAALSGFSFANTRNAVMRLSNRLRAIRHGAGGGIDTSGFSLFDESGQFRSKSLLADTSTIAPTGLQLMEPAVYSDPRLGMFVSGSGTFGDYDGDVNGSGYDYDAASVLIGADYRVTDTAAVGIYGGYDRTDATLGNNGGQAGADTARFGVTGTWWMPVPQAPLSSVTGERNDTVYLEANAGGAHHWYETDRNGFGGVASGDTTATELSAGGTLGYEFKKGNLRFGPEVSLSYTHLWTEGFTETGSLAPLNIASGTRDSLYSTVGARASYQFRISGFEFNPFLSAGWRHEYFDTQGATTARFAAGVGSAFTVNGSSQARDSIVAGAGINAILNDWLSAELSYSGEGSADTEIHSINGSITARF
ncbi:MAG: autotransporter domain-containing protein, partial [Verrucomicrobiota bacterium]